MNTIILILAVVALTFVTTEALYVHKISDQDEMVPKTVQMCRISCFQKVSGWLRGYQERFYEQIFTFTVYKRKEYHRGQYRQMQQQFNVFHVLGLLWSLISGIASYYGLHVLRLCLCKYFLSYNNVNHDGLLIVDIFFSFSNSILDASLPVFITR